jgi:hypothetical protein
VGLRRDTPGRVSRCRRLRRRAQDQAPRAAAHHVVTYTRPPLRLVSVALANDTQGVDGAGEVTVNQALPASAPMPQLAPAVAGAWTPRRGHGDPRGEPVTVTP